MPSKEAEDGQNLESSIHAPEGFDLKVQELIDLEQLRKEPSRIIEREKIRDQFKSQDLGRRAAPRYSIELEVLAIIPGRSVRTKTRNVSLVGCYLSESLPVEFNNRLFEITLFYQRPGQVKKDSFMFHAQTVDAPLASYRVQFVRSVGDSLERLFNLFRELGLE